VCHGDQGPTDRTAIAMAEWLRVVPYQSIRRECLDHLVLLGEAQVRRILTGYAKYDGETRTHLALNKDCPVHRPVQYVGSITSQVVPGGLHHKYVRV
jgi:hypothetical protein